MDGINYDKELNKTLHCISYREQYVGGEISKTFALLCHLNPVVNNTKKIGRQHAHLGL